MRIMFLSHLPENPKAKERNAKIREQLSTYASPGTQVELCFPDDYPGAKLSEDLVARNETPGLYHVLQTPALLRKIVWAQGNGYDAVVQSNTFDPGVEAGREAVRIPVIGLSVTLYALSKPGGVERLLRLLLIKPDGACGEILHLFGISVNPPKRYI